MGRHKLAYKDDDAATAHRNKSIKDFFKVKRPQATKQVGRPKKRVGRPRTAVEIAEEIRHTLVAPDHEQTTTLNGKNNDAQSGSESNAVENEKEGSAPPPTSKKENTTTRINWGRSPHREILMDALDAWNDKTDLKFDENGEEILDYKIFANRMQIPPPTFYAYIHPDDNKRRKLGDGERGKKKLLSEDDVKLAGEVLARQDRANDGYTPQEAKAMIGTLNPNITERAAAQQLYRRIMPVNFAAGILKRKTVKLQATTSDRTNINAAQQWRFHTLVDTVFDELRDANLGKCKKLGKTFGEVFEHFVIGLDETCIMSKGHTMKIIGARDKSKHELRLQDGRKSITLVRTGTPGGTTGPTIFILKGSANEPTLKCFSDKFLEKYGCAPGSTILFNENAYMTDETWMKASEAIVRGYRQMPYINDNPDWWVCEFLDGFKSHENVLGAHTLRRDKKIKSVKEESNTSHVNQAYDQLVAKSDKKIAAEALCDQRKIEAMKTGKKNIDQYALVLTGIRLVSETTPELWTSSFRKVNLDPRRRTPFVEWMTKIQRFVTASVNFKDENVGPNSKEKFALLPSFWHVMKPSERKVVMTIMQLFSYSWSAECITRIVEECAVTIGQMQDLRTCIIVAKDHPETLEYNLNTLLAEKVRDDEEAARSAEPEELKNARSSAVSINLGLDNFQLIPKDSMGNSKYTGEKLFEHMCKYRNIHAAAKSVQLEPSAGLDIHLQPDSMTCIIPTNSQLRHGEVLRDAVGEGAECKCSQRKLTNIGTVVGQCAVLNSDENIKKIENNLMFVAAVAEVARHKTNEKSEKEKQKKKQYDDIAPKAAAKLEKNGRNIETMSVKEMEALLLVIFGVSMPRSGVRKNEVQRRLRKTMEDDTAKKYERFLLLHDILLSEDAIVGVDDADDASGGAADHQLLVDGNNGQAV